MSTILHWLIVAVGGAYCSSLQQTALGASPRVDLGYATYEGTRLAAGVDQYLGMRYARPPLGNLRFRAPENPLNVSGIQSAGSFQPVCIGVNQAATKSTAEDCLFVNVFAPSNATADSKLPVWVYIQGGGYATNSNNDYNGTGVVHASGNNVVFVNFNYRVGALGFLASERIRKDGALNAGLLDQRALLLWVQKYIQLFGGDPKHVVIHGASAGAGSVIYQLTAYGGRNESLFVGAAPESPFWPTQRTVAEMEFQFDRFANDTGCVSASQDVMSCLRAANLSSIISANIVSPFPEASAAPLPRWYFLPVVDGDFVADHTYNLLSRGQFVRVPMLIGHDTDEGTAFAANASSPAEFIAFMKNNYPHLSEEQLRIINDTYPLTQPLPRHAVYFPSAAEAYGDTTFTCPAITVASTNAKDVRQTFIYRYNVLDPDNIAAGTGVPHTFETTAIFGVGNAGNAAASYSSSNAGIVPVTMNYWISFVRTLDPNPFRAPGSPMWDPWGSGDGRRIKLQTNATAMEDVPSSLRKTCDLWEGIRKSVDG